MLTLEAFTRVAKRLADDGSDRYTKYVVSDMNLDARTIKLENNKGVDFIVTLIERDQNIENGTFKLVVNEVNYYGQDINLTSLRRHNFVDYDDNSRIWKVDKHGNSWERVVYMRTHNKLYDYFKDSTDSFSSFMGHINHVAELGYNAAERNDDWSRAAMAVKSKRGENLANIDALIALEEPALPAVTVFNELGVDIKDYCQMYGKTVSVKQYSTFAIVNYTSRIGTFDAEQSTLASDWSYDNACVCVIETEYKFEFDTCAFEQTAQHVDLKNWSVKLNKMQICSDIDYSERRVEPDSDSLKAHLKRYVNVMNNRAALTDLI